MTCAAPCFEFKILAVCLNSCAYLENRKHYWNHIYTWAVGGSRHLNDSNFPTIWINVTNAVFSSGIGCLQQLAPAASQCAIVDCAQLPLSFHFFPPSSYWGKCCLHHHIVSSCPTLRKHKTVCSAIRSRWSDLEVRTTKVWLFDHRAWHV